MFHDNAKSFFIDYDYYFEIHLIIPKKQPKLIIKERDDVFNLFCLFPEKSPFLFSL